MSNKTSSDQYDLKLNSIEHQASELFAPRRDERLDWFKCIFVDRNQLFHAF